MDGQSRFRELTRGLASGPGVTGEGEISALQLRSDPIFADAEGCGSSTVL